MSIGIAEVIDWLGRTFQTSGGTIRLELHDVLANDEHAVALVRIRADRPGEQLDDRSVQVFHIRDGKAAEVWTYPADLYASDAFWAVTAKDGL